MKYLRGNYPTSPHDELIRLAATTADTDAGTHTESGDVYGTGKLIEDFEAEVAALLSKDAAVFMPSGTMAQLIAMRIWTDRKKSKQIAFHPTSHLELHEQHAYKELHGLSAELLGDPSQTLNIDDFRASKTKIAAAIVELPQREIGGTLPSWDELIQISGHCRENEIALHMDGARLWESAAFYGRSYAEISALFDSVYVSFYKGLGGITGAMLLGPKDFIAEAKIWQRRHGGGLYQMYPYVLSARDGLRQRLPKMSKYHEKAKDIAKALLEMEGIKVIPATPHTCMMHLEFTANRESLEQAFKEIAAEDKVMMFARLQKGSRDDVCKAELTVGDATLDLSTAEIAQLFRKAMSKAATNSAGPA